MTPMPYDDTTALENASFFNHDTMIISIISNGIAVVRASKCFVTLLGVTEVQLMYRVTVPGGSGLPQLACHLRGAQAGHVRACVMNTGHPPAVLANTSNVQECFLKLFQVWRQQKKSWADRERRNS